MAPTTHVLLSRDAFREAVFARDNGKCVLCGAPGVDAHHLLERRLWKSPGEEGGYFLDNGATVCGDCHLRCERTEVSVEDVRRAAGITHPIVPAHLYEDAEQPYDKWGNPILPDGRRMRGEMMDDASVRKVLDQSSPPVVWAEKVKYPRTYHLPWSPGVTKDDRVLPDASCFEGRRVVITQKMDGENTSLYPDGLHARSLDYSPHESRNWVKALWSRICGDIPEGWRVCGENLYARHTVPYHDLPSFFLAFSIWSGLNCLSWDDTVEWAALLGLDTVPVLYDGPWDEAMVRGLKVDVDRHEGFVVRVADSFHYRDFNRSVAKWVRPGHVAGTHWKRRGVEPNRLAAR